MEIVCEARWGFINDKDLNCGSGTFGETKALDSAVTEHETSNANTTFIVAVMILFCFCWSSQPNTTRIIEELLTTMKSTSLLVLCALLCSPDLRSFLIRVNLLVLVHTFDIGIERVRKLPFRLSIEIDDLLCPGVRRKKISSKNTVHSAYHLTTMAGESMEVDTPPVQPPPEEEEEEDCSDLVDLLDSVSDATPAAQIPILTSIINEPKNRYGSTASALKERAVYALARAYCEDNRHDEVVTLLTGETCAPFFANITKAKTAKVVRAVLDAVCALAPEELDMQAQICQNIIGWCRAEKRSFLRQRVEAKMASVLFQQDKYGEALTLVDNLLLELKKLDDKQLLVEVHLVESKIHHGLRGMAKSKAALTASRTNANAIYVAPSLQSQIDLMSGVLHCEEGDYDTAHSYFLEAFEQLDQLDDREKAVPCLKHMMLCKILDGLNKALGISAATGVAGIRSDHKNEADISGMISGKRGVKYAGRDVEAMSAIAAAASKRSLKEYEAVLSKYSHELQDDLLIKHHLGTLQEQLLESNLIRIIEPYSCVEIEHVASLIEMPLSVVEKKLSQMILDGKFHGILDQGKGQLIVYEDADTDQAMEKRIEGNRKHGQGRDLSVW